MFVFIDKITKESFASKSKKEISKVTGIDYNRLNYYSRKNYYENNRLIFLKANILKSKQGGFRTNNNVS